jgi:hypothetical protein
MIINEVEEDGLIDGFVLSDSTTKEDLLAFLRTSFLHPKLYRAFGTIVSTHLVEITYPFYASLPKDKKRHFLRALVTLLQLAVSMKLWEVRLSSDDSGRRWASAPLFFASLVRLTEPLERIRRELASIDQGFILERILLVEGESEAAFVETIQMSTELTNFDFTVYPYGGKGQVKNLIQYIREKNRQGLRVHLVYDRDRQSDTFLEKLHSQCLIEKSFGFERDFEGSFPPHILNKAIQEYVRRYAKAPLEGDTLPIDELLGSHKPVIVALEEKLGLKISKAKLGVILAELTLPETPVWAEVTNERPLSTELGRFLKFLMLW